MLHEMAGLSSGNGRPQYSLKLTTYQGRPGLNIQVVLETWVSFLVDTV